MTCYMAMLIFNIMFKVISISWCLLIIHQATWRVTGADFFLFGPQERYFSLARIHEISCLLLRFFQLRLALSIELLFALSLSLYNGLKLENWHLLFSAQFQVFLARRPNMLNWREILFPLQYSSPRWNCPIFSPCKDKQIRFLGLSWNLIDFSKAEFIASPFATSGSGCNRKLVFFTLFKRFRLWKTVQSNPGLCCEGMAIAPYENRFRSMRCQKVFNFSTKSHLL